MIRLIPPLLLPLVFLTNHLDISALTVALFYRLRWRIELFFRWIKGHL
jgi:IS4 transposase